MSFKQVGQTQEEIDKFVQQYVKTQQELQNKSSADTTGVLQAKKKIEEFQKPVTSLLGTFKDIDLSILTPEQRNQAIKKQGIIGVLRSINKNTVPATQSSDTPIILAILTDHLLRQGVNINDIHLIVQNLSDNSQSNRTIYRNLIKIMNDLNVPANDIFNFVNNVALAVKDKTLAEEALQLLGDQNIDDIKKTQDYIAKLEEELEREEKNPEIKKLYEKEIKKYSESLLDLYEKEIEKYNELLRLRQELERLNEESEGWDFKEFSDEYSVGELFDTNLSKEEINQSYSSSSSEEEIGEEYILSEPFKSSEISEPFESSEILEPSLLVSGPPQIFQNEPFEIPLEGESLSSRESIELPEISEEELSRIGSILINPNRPQSLQYLDFYPVKNSITNSQLVAEGTEDEIYAFLGPYKYRHYISISNDNEISILSPNTLKKKETIKFTRREPIDFFKYGDGMDGLTLLEIGIISNIYSKIGYTNALLVTPTPTNILKTNKFIDITAGTGEIPSREFLKNAGSSKKAIDAFYRSVKKRMEIFNINPIKSFGEGLFPQKNFNRVKKGGEVNLMNPPTFGKMQKKRNPYKIDNNGYFGDILINPQRLLGKLHLEVVKDGNRILDQPADADLLELLTKRYNPKKTYSDYSIQLFRRLVDLSELPITPTSKKFEILSNDQKKGVSPMFNNKSVKKEKMIEGGEIKIYSDINDVVNRMGAIVASIEAGNNSQILKKELFQIIDLLKNKGKITNEIHSIIYNKYIK